MEPVIQHAETDDEIAATFDVMAQLRPDLVREEYVPLIRSLMKSDAFRLLYLAEGGVVRAVAGYRLMHMLYCGRLLSIDDLVTDASVRSRGYGARLLAALREEARRQDCREIHLISRVIRERAHQFYKREGFTNEYVHFALVW